MEKDEIKRIKTNSRMAIKAAGKIRELTDSQEDIFDILQRAVNDLLGADFKIIKDKTE